MGVLQREPKAAEGPKTQKKNGCAPSLAVAALRSWARLSLSPAARRAAGVFCEEATGGVGIGGEQRERDNPIDCLVGLAWFGVAASACASISCFSLRYPSPALFPASTPPPCVHVASRTRLQPAPCTAQTPLARYLIRHTSSQYA